MKVKKFIGKVLIVMIVILIGLGNIKSIGFKDEEIEIALSPFRYVNGQHTNGYALNTVGKESHRRIFQLMEMDADRVIGTNFYCLNATVGETWNDLNQGGNSAIVTYNRSYDLNSQSDLDILKADTSLASEYTNIAKSEYLPQILWILDNIYIPDSNATTEENSAQKRAVLARAGIVYAKKIVEDFSGPVETENYTYKYVPQEGYDYTSKLRNMGADLTVSLEGYDYYDPEDNFHTVELPDEMVEVAQQAALWYYTNYLDNNENNSETYNIKDQWLQLLCSNGTDETDALQWPALISDDAFKEETNIEGYYAEIGRWKQEQASILCEYLIDAANNYAENASDTDRTTSPLTITPEIANISTKTVNNTNYYVVGPIKIEKERDSIYDLSNTIKVNNNTNTGAYISDVNGNKQDDKTVASSVGEDFYIAIPTSSVSGNNIKIDFEGTYKSNDKKLWISTTKKEQPIVEVTPKSESMTLTVSSELTSVTVNKVWEDSNNQDGKRASYEVTLIGKVGTEEVYKDIQTLNATTTTYTWSNLAKYKDGQEIIYTVDETKVPEGYTKVVDGTTITNSYLTEKVNIPVEKIWNDKDNMDKTRPTSITLILKADGAEIKRQGVTADAEGNWKYEFTDLDKYKEGKEIVYTVEEAPVENYTTEIEGSAEEGYTITNTYKAFDLALRKTITKITDASGEVKQVINEAGETATRNITYVTEDIEKNRTATYNHRKDPVVVAEGDIVTYKITVYNEGDMDGYAETIVDKLPEGLKAKESTGTYTSGNISYTYVYDEETNTITFTNVSKNVLEAYDGGDTLSSETIEIECEVTQKPSTETNTYLTNIAYITKEYNSETQEEVTTDRDSSTTNSPEGEQTTTGDTYTGYHGGDNNNGNNNKDVYTDGVNNDDYFPGREDDDDFEVIVVKPSKVDLALTKFITAVSEDAQIDDGEYITADGHIGSKTNPYTRATKVDTVELRDNEECHDATYTMVKDPLKVPERSYVLYNIRIYNEGETDVYAGEVADYLPEYLEYVECDFNNVYGWEVSEDGRTVTTTYLSYENGTQNLLKAFDKETDDGAGSGLDYRDLQILCKLTDNAPTNSSIKNTAEITVYEDENGNEIPKDIDSIPDNIEENLGEDDEDFEQIIIEPELIDIPVTKVWNDNNDQDGIRPEEIIIKLYANDQLYKTLTLTAEGGVESAVPTARVESEGSDTNTWPTYVFEDLPKYQNGEEVIYKVVEENVPEGYEVEITGDMTNGFVVTNTHNPGKVEIPVEKIWEDKNNRDETRPNSITLILKADGAEIGRQEVTPDAEGNWEYVFTNLDKYKEGKEIVYTVEEAPVEKYTTEITGNAEEGYTITNTYEAFDMALQKYITSIYSKGETKEGRQGPTIDTTNLANGTSTTAEYTQDKTPIKVKHGDYVTYTFTVYNEGDENGYINKITDNIPTGLEFVYAKQPEDGKTLIVCNSKGETEELEVDEETYKLVSENNASWSIDTNGENLKTDTYNGEETISITCDVVSYLGGENKLLEAYDSSQDTNHDGIGLDSLSVTVVLRVGAQNGKGEAIRNEAAITEAEDEEGNKQDTEDLKDRDSQTDEWPGKDGEKEYQDDEDYDNIILEKVDLALSKFIAAVSDDTQIDNGEYLTEDGNEGSETNPYTRATSVDTTELRDNPECHDATYTMVKDPLTVPAQSYVLYNIRVYNEGETDVYAGEVTDHLPDYLDYVDCEFNREYQWEVGADGKTIKTTYLSHENGEENLLNAFDKATDDGAGSGLDYRDLQILCRVNDKAPSNTNIVNIAEITEYEDEEGEEIPEDTDSTPDNVEDEPKEDDEDNEIILIKTFDLNLLKYVSTVYVTEDGVTTETQTGNTGNDETDIIPKVEINRKKLDSTIVRFGYTIKVTNEGDIAGYAKEITDYVPEGLRFYEEDNEGWTDEGNNVISTRLLENTLLQPGESAEVTVIFRWINGSDNLGLKTNTAEISEDYNDEGVPDRDSTPDNQVPGEDDIDEAQVLLSISTGLIGNIIMYTSAGAIILVVFAGGIILIKKFVL